MAYIRRQRAGVQEYGDKAVSEDQSNYSFLQNEIYDDKQE